MASMAGAPRVRSLNVAAPEADARPVLVPGGNKARSGPAAARKPSPKQPQPQLRKAAEATPEKPPPAVAAAEEQAEAEGAKKAAAGGECTGGARKGLSSSPLRSPRRTPPASRKKQQELAAPLSASCSSEPASVEPLHGRASGGRTERSLPRPVAPKRGKAAAKAAEKDADVLPEVVVVAPVTPEDVVQGKRRCAWVTPTTDPYYVTFHDEEWGVPVHDDRRLFELLVLCGALAELSWPEILKRRQNFREIFMDFDPLAIAKINEKKLVAPGSIATSLLSEQKLRAVLENARQIIKIADEFGSFNQYCWGFLYDKPMVSKFRYPRQVPVKSPKADMISKDMLRRGFRGVGPTVVYSFMQAAGLTNDHHISCFRFKECNAPPTPRTSDADRVKADELRTKNCSEEMSANADLSRAIDALTISQDHEEQ
ncbi:uncharacterized protein LOC100841287 [Brachypodium distachyon]|uniref:Uncharacterized protein n=1 Tax=Brachypodium distachyon TaxID=15368 RepID=A0A0Q3JFY8_BRADI|nr:uncharacterized protein LOC100841287 [Brachypodium distachyon]KQK16835.1 hypothetical protein BRADI_1g30920v3 [Brachypodium distachyon]|eukprot:XP_003560364.2 uncharacterized protein LOC100841287 [Brachypodium distachyon]